MTLEKQVARNLCDLMGDEWSLGRAVYLKRAREIIAMCQPQWQPIATAPRDGTWFLAVTAGADWWRPRIVRFYDERDRFPKHENMSPWSVAPTHWMPLPEPPTTPR